MPRQSKRRVGAGRAKKDKPELHSLKGSEITFESLGEMFRRLTGREPTPEEIEEARREWDRLEKESEKPNKGKAKK